MQFLPRFASAPDSVALEPLPIFGQDFRGCDPFGGVGLQELADQIACGRGVVDRASERIALPSAKGGRTLPSLGRERCLMLGTQRPLRQGGIPVRRRHATRPQCSSKEQQRAAGVRRRVQGALAFRARGAGGRWTSLAGNRRRTGVGLEVGMRALGELEVPLINGFE